MVRILLFGMLLFSMPDLNSSNQCGILFFFTELPTLPPVMLMHVTSSHLASYGPLVVFEQINLDPMILNILR